MTTVVKIHRKGQMTLPPSLRQLAGISEGDFVQASFKDGKIVITPSPIIDRTQFPTADDEYTPEQRRIIDARLDQADEDVKAGRIHGPFETHKEMVDFLHKEATKAKSQKITKPKS